MPAVGAAPLAPAHWTFAKLRWCLVRLHLGPVLSGKITFIEMAFEVVFKFILLLKFLGQLCMLTKFTNKLVYPTECQKAPLTVHTCCCAPLGAMDAYG